MKENRFKEINFDEIDETPVSQQNTILIMCLIIIIDHQRLVHHSCDKKK